MRRTTRSIFRNPLVWVFLLCVAQGVCVAMAVYHGANVVAATIDGKTQPVVIP